MRVLWDAKLEWREEGWLVKPGRHDFSDSRATVLDNHTRFVPDTSPSDCQIVTVGDSITFGLWVDDEDTWVNQLARLLPDVEFINAGVPGYNSSQLVHTFSRYPDASGYLYVVVDNDHTNGIIHRVMTPNNAELYVTGYIKAVINRVVVPTYEPQWEQFWHDFDEIANHDNLLIFTYNHAISEGVTERYPQVIWLDWTPEPLSFIDVHPTPRSHTELAALMLPYIKAFSQEVCQ
ncbi:MAG: hypothetical protein K8I82_24380 [Anaerolineae bacterium]|nr:hypothetical protein [Anaerolineae bacterium]